ncbi:hypothetical protein MYCFIDRAFT_49331 [Lecanosticta acicola]|uniref:Uncharacterized protein n=1 Tax=Lecanosticta acicola TaxID=111012 RepID=A0AAI8W284_9PEZI|nr:hypothetical protein MYCFIDRAFT_49331 [Lecanosticta acicola]
MESMDYNYFTSAPHSYHYMGYEDILPQNSGNGLTATPSMEPLDSGAFTFGNSDYDFNAHLPQSYTVTPLPTGSASPPPQSISILHHGSVDSGIALDLDTEHEQRSGRRGSSEEKDALTPAQSRRKAQNRAA